MDNNQNENNSDLPQSRPVRSSGISNLTPLSSADDLVKQRREQEQIEMQRIKAAQEQTNQARQDNISVPQRPTAYQPANIYPAGTANLRTPQAPAASTDQAPQSVQSVQQPPITNQPLQFSPNSDNNNPAFNQNPQNPNSPQQQTSQQNSDLNNPIWMGILGFFVWPISIAAIIFGSKYKKQTGNGTTQILGIIACILGLWPFIMIVMFVIGFIGLGAMIDSNNITVPLETESSSVQSSDNFAKGLSSKIKISA